MHKSCEVPVMGTEQRRPNLSKSRNRFEKKPPVNFKIGKDAGRLRSDGVIGNRGEAWQRS